MYIGIIMFYCVEMFLLLGISTVMAGARPCWIPGHLLMLRNITAEGVAEARWVALLCKKQKETRKTKKNRTHTNPLPKRVGPRTSSIFRWKLIFHWIGRKTWHFTWYPGVFYKVFLIQYIQPIPHEITIFLWLFYGFHKIFPSPVHLPASFTPQAVLQSRALQWLRAWKTWAFAHARRRQNWWFLGVVRHGDWLDVNTDRIWWDHVGSNNQMVI